MIAISRLCYGYTCNRYLQRQVLVTWAPRYTAPARVRSTDAPSRGHSVLNLRNIYITKHMPRIKPRLSEARRAGLGPASCHIGFDQSSRRRTMSGRRRHASARPVVIYAIQGRSLANRRMSLRIHSVGKYKNRGLVGRSGWPATMGTCRSIVGRVREARVRDVTARAAALRRCLLNGAPSTTHGRRQPRQPNHLTITVTRTYHG